jgi:hypothetical protein
LDAWLAALLLAHRYVSINVVHVHPLPHARNEAHDSREWIETWLVLPAA